MSRSRRKTQEMKHVSFRMPADAHQDYVTVAESRGVDLSALLNWVVTEYRPLLLLRWADNRAAMLRASVIGIPREPLASQGLQEALDRVNDLIRTLQDVASKLSGQVNASESRAAA